MKLIELHSKNYDQTIIEVGEVIGSGGVAILPFDTVYGFACDPKNDFALKKVFALKERSVEKIIGLAVPDLKTLKSISQISIEAESLLKDKVPGKYTFIVASQSTQISKFCEKDGTFGIRIPDKEFILKTIQAAGGIIAQTSANKSGKPNCFSIEELKNQYGEELNEIDLIVDGGKIEDSNASQIIDITKDEPRYIERN